VVLLQLEIPLDAAIRAAELGQRAGASIVLNPAPAPAMTDSARKLVTLSDFVVPNQSEIEQLTGVEAYDRKSARAAAIALRALGARRVILTLGDQGALHVDDAGAEEAAAFPVNVVDTTAAGDAFLGALAAALASGRRASDAVVLGCAGGALACTKLGAEPSLPRAREIDALFLTRG
jgi:ribokinase